jgi:glycogen synthase
MMMKTRMFIAKQFAKKHYAGAKDAMKTLGAKIESKGRAIRPTLEKYGEKINKHVKKHKLKYSAGAGAAVTAGIFSQHQKQKNDGTHARLKKELKKKGYI